jgi:hypothetical protein
MGIFQRIKNRITVKTAYYNAPIPTDGDQYAYLPDPGPGLQGDFALDPNRVHAPYPMRSTEMDHLNEGSGDPSLHRFPDVPSTQYYKATKDIPREPIKVPAHGVFVPGSPRGFGWKQGFVPEAGRRVAMVASAPPPMLDKPIVEVIVDKGYSKRTPVKLKAPAPYRRDS